MFANRFTGLVDACSLVSPLRRNLLLSLAEAEFFRVRWSALILDETEKAIAKVLAGKGDADSAGAACRARRAMERAFTDAMVDGYEPFLCVGEALPDPGDAHVLAAAIKTQAAVIVTENLKHFPDAVLRQMNLSARSADQFIADTIDLDHGRAVAAIRNMRERFNKPSLDGAGLLLAMDASGLVETVDVLRPHEGSI